MILLSYVYTPQFLNVTMKDNKTGRGRHVTRFVKAFQSAVALVHKKLGDRPFHLRGPLNTAVLDSVLGTIITHQSRLRGDWKTQFDKLVRNSDFNAATRAATADVSAVHSRFRLSEQFLLK
jgi:hypothetical protein